MLTSRSSYAQNKNYKVKKTTKKKQNKNMDKKWVFTLIWLCLANSMIASMAALWILGVWRSRLRRQNGVMESQARPGRKASVVYHTILPCYVQGSYNSTVLASPGNSHLQLLITCSCKNGGGRSGRVTCVTSGRCEGGREEGGEGRAQRRISRSLL